MGWTFYNSSGQKLSTAATSIDVLDIDGATDIGAAIVDADLFIIDDGAGGTNRKTTAARLKTYAFGSGLSARAYESATFAVANATDTVVLFDSERFDTDTIHDVSSNTGRLTATTAGVYIIIGHISFPTNTTGFRSVHIRAEGSTELAFETRAPSSNATNVSISTITNLSATDYVELLVYQSSGGSLTLPADANYQQSFAMARISG